MATARRLRRREVLGRDGRDVLERRRVLGGQKPTVGQNQPSEQHLRGRRHFLSD